MSDTGKGIFYGFSIAIFALLIFTVVQGVWKQAVERSAYYQAVELTNKSREQRQALITELAECQVKLDEQHKKTIPQEQAQSE